MTQREKLIELIVKCDKENEVLDCFESRPKKAQAAEIIADHLLHNGVIVPPCKVGDTVYTISRKALGGHWEDTRYIVDEWSELKVCEIPFSLTLWECGLKDIFLTREEAERKLKRGEQNACND